MMPLARTATTALLVLSLVWPATTLALRINTNDIGTPVEPKHPAQPAGFEAGNGWTVYWATSCEQAAALNVMWSERCKERLIKLVSRKMLEAMARNPNSGVNYLPEPFQAGYLRFTRQGLLGQVILRYDSADHDKLREQLAARYAEAGTPLSGPDRAAYPGVADAGWIVGDVEISLRQQVEAYRQGLMTLTYLPLADGLAQSR